MPDRIALFSFHEENGIARPYISYYLKALKQVASRLIVIVNGIISSDSRKALKTLGAEILVREDKGGNFGAWRYAIATELGLDTIAEYDDLILCDNSVYGPVYPLKNCFDRMAEADCDFWGMTCHPENQTAQLLTSQKNSYIREHIQCWFMVLRKPILISSAFRDWWNNLVIYNNDKKEIYYHETQFTGYLSAAGFTYRALGEIDSQGIDPSIYCGDRLLSSGQIPFIKREIFTSPLKETLQYSANLISSNILTYIRKETDYNEGLILEDLVATQEVGILRGSLHLNHTLPSASRLPGPSYEEENSSVALLHFAYYPDIADYYCRYIRNMPETAHIYIISSREDTLSVYREKLQDIKNPLEFRIKPNRGRDVSGYLVAGADIFKRHDIVCCTHDKKSPQLGVLRAKDFNENSFRCVLESKEYVLNVLDLFRRNPYTGLLVPPAPAFGPFAFIGNENAKNGPVLNRLCRDFDIKVPFKESQLAPFGSVFWVRGKAMKTILSKKWDYTDFPDEPLPSDGTILHALECFYPVAAQNDGFLTAICMPDIYSSIYFNNILYQYREILKDTYRLIGHAPFLATKGRMKNFLDQKALEEKTKQRAEIEKRKLQDKLYIQEEKLKQQRKQDEQRRAENNRKELDRIEKKYKQRHRRSNLIIAILIILIVLIGLYSFFNFI